MATKAANCFSSPTISQMEEFAAMPYSFRTHHRAETSSTIFRLNYGATVLILIAASLAVTMKQFGGRPIECVVDKELNVEVVNNFCWIHATFSTWKLSGNLSDFTHDLSEGSPIDRDAIFMIDTDGYKMVRAGQLDTGPPGGDAKVTKYTHGILHSSGPYPGVETTTNDSFLRYHKYVQWVAGILIFQKKKCSFGVEWGVDPPGALWYRLASDWSRVVEPKFGSANGRYLGHVFFGHWNWLLGACDPGNVIGKNQSLTYV